MFSFYFHPISIKISHALLLDNFPSWILGGLVCIFVWVSDHTVTPLLHAIFIDCWKEHWNISCWFSDKYTVFRSITCPRLNQKVQLIWVRLLSRSLASSVKYWISFMKDALCRTFNEWWRCCFLENIIRSIRKASSENIMKDL
jgi:hypothetical protein